MRGSAGKTARHNKKSRSGACKAGYHMTSSRPPQAGVPPEAHPWLALNMAYGPWPALRTQWVHHLTTAGVLQRLQQDGLGALYGLIPGIAEKIALVQQGEPFNRELERLAALHVTVVTLVEACYPQALRWIADPPPVLYVQGSMHADDGFAVAVVGSRKPSPYGKLTAQRLSIELVQHGFTIVSGLARGIDGAAHQSAIQAGGRTFAVLGSGINVVYPPEHRRLSEAISKQGAVISEFPLDTKPDRWNFPRRNRIISGLALGTLVVEASENSGSLHTVRHAMEQGREVFAVPGRIDVPSSRGTNGLIKQGAKLVETCADVLEEFSESTRAGALQRQRPVDLTQPSSTAALTAQETQVLAVLEGEERHIDAVIQDSQLPAHVVASILVTLELQGLVRQFPGKLFARC